MDPSENCEGESGPCLSPSFWWFVDSPWCSLACRCISPSLHLSPYGISRLGAGRRSHSFSFDYANKGLTVQFQGVMPVTTGEQRRKRQIIAGEVSWKSASRMGRVLAALNSRLLWDSLVIWISKRISKCIITTEKHLY